MATVTRWGKRALFAAGNVLGIAGLVVVCIADDLDARRRAKRAPEGM